MNSLVQDVRHAWRLLRTQKTFTVVVLLTLTVGIGANTAIFSLLNGVLLRPLPYAQPERLHLLFDSMVRDPSRQVRLSALDFIDWRDQNRTFDGIAAYVGTGYTFQNTGAEPELVRGHYVSSELFPVLGVQPILGRDFRAEDTEAGQHHVVMIGYGLWQRRFGGDPTVINRTITVNDTSYTIAGVMPPGFAFPDGRAEAWTPLVLRGTPPADAPPLNRQLHYLTGIGRLKPGVSLQQGRDELSRISESIAAQSQSGRVQSLGAKVIPLSDAIVGSLRPALIMLAAAVGCVLLIACANVTHLQLAQINGRERELAVRLALGASRGRIVRQILTETALLALAGGLGGVLLASWLLQLATLLGADQLPLMNRVAIDVPVLLFTITIAAVSSLLFGLLPASQIARAQISERLLAATRGVTAGRRGQLLRSGLIVAEVALSLMLLVSAGLLIRSFVKLQQVDPGFDPTHRVTMTFGLPASRYPQAAQMLAFMDNVVERLRRQPGIEAVGFTTALPMSGQDTADAFTVEGYTPPRPGASPMASIRGVTPDFFKALGLRVLRGRAFSDRDSASTEPVVLVNEAFARRYFPGVADVVGKRLQNSSNGTGTVRTVVGLVADVHHRGAAIDPSPEVYFPYEQLNPDSMTIIFRGTSLVVRTSLDLQAVSTRIRTELAEADPAMPLAKIVTMDAVVAESLAQPRLQTWLVGLFGVTALLLASVGIFGIVSFLVSQRTREIGVRIALGAQSRDVLRSVLGRALGLTMFGVAIGLPGAWALSRGMQTMLFGISPTDTVTLVTVPLLLVFVATLAALAPARRAARIDPMVAWRSE